MPIAVPLPGVRSSEPTYLRAAAQDRRARRCPGSIVLADNLSTAVDRRAGRRPGAAAIADDLTAAAIDRRARRRPGAKVEADILEAAEAMVVPLSVPELPEPDPTYWVVCRVPLIVPLLSSEPRPMLSARARRHRSPVALFTSPRVRGRRSKVAPRFHMSEAGISAPSGPSRAE